MNKLTIDDVELKNKRVLVRVDFNVPLDENQNITDDTGKELKPAHERLIDENTMEAVNIIQIVRAAVFAHVDQLGRPLYGTKRCLDRPFRFAHECHHRAVGVLARIDVEQMGAVGV